MVTARLRAQLVLLTAGGAILLSACGNATPQSGAAPAPASPTSATPPFSVPPTVPSGGGGVQPGPTGIPIGTGKPVVIDGIIETGVEPGCKVLNAGNTRYLVLTSKDVPMGVPVRVEGVLQPGVLSTCQQGTPLRVTSVKRR